MFPGSIIPVKGTGEEGYNRYKRSEAAIKGWETRRKNALIENILNADRVGSGLKSDRTHRAAA
jgi:hypothetical protein